MYKEIKLIESHNDGRINELKYEVRVHKRIFQPLMPSEGYAQVFGWVLEAMEKHIEAQEWDDYAILNSSLDSHEGQYDEFDADKDESDLFIYEISLKIETYI